eukprot:9476291-Pyramimonas_sp.AAC.1
MAILESGRLFSVCAYHRCRHPASTCRLSSVRMPWTSLEDDSRRGPAGSSTRTSSLRRACVVAEHRPRCRP